MNNRSEPSRRQYVSIMAKDHSPVAALSARWCVRVIASSRSSMPGEVILGPAFLNLTGSDDIDLSRVEYDLWSVKVTRTGRWEKTTYGYVAWVDFDDDWITTSDREKDSSPSAGLALRELTGLS